MSNQRVIAEAHPNIALVKYWGKRDVALNLPAVGSISITLDTLKTVTELQFDPELSGDHIVFNGVQAQGRAKQRISEFVDLFRGIAGISTAVAVTSSNNFPTGAGLASSASGFAALALACKCALRLDMDDAMLSGLARRGSGSAARSLFGGFAEWYLGEKTDGSDSVAAQLHAREHWPLSVVIAITSEEEKKVGSTDGMNQTMQTSAYYPAWIADQDTDLNSARDAIARKDFEQLAEVSEASCLKMHASALAARPGLFYWNATSLACLLAVRELRASGLPVFFTVDAGPQVKAICLPEAADQVAAALEVIPGVQRLLRTELGGAATVRDLD